MADDVPLAFYQPTGLFLKPDAKVSLEVKLPEIRGSGSISNWEVMEKIKTLSKPEEFQTLRVVNYSRERILFEGEFDSLRAMRKVVLLLNHKSMKLTGFSELLKIKAKKSEPPHPAKKEWEDYFIDRGIETFEEGHPGERPDTLHISDLPVKWFSSSTSEGRPCPRVLTLAFQKFGKVRQVGIYETSSRDSNEFSSFGPTKQLYFDAYIQYEKYASFCSAMSGLKGMKLIRLESGGREAVARLQVDFDRTAYLSDKNVRKRQRAEEKRQRELEEQRKREEEERKGRERKRQLELEHEEEAKALKKAKKQEEKRNKKQKQILLVAQLKAVAMQRREEAQRLLRVLLAGAAETKYNNRLTFVSLFIMLSLPLRYQEEEREKTAAMEQQQREAGQQRRKEKLEEEVVLRDKLMKNVQQLEQRRLEIQRELKLRNRSSGSQLKSAIVVPRTGND